MEGRQGRGDGQKGTEKAWKWTPETDITVPSPEKCRKRGGRGETAFACGHESSEAWGKYWGKRANLKEPDPKEDFSASCGVRKRVG